MMILIDSISNINLHYAREPQNPYGSSGRPAQFQIEETFYNSLESAIEEVFNDCPLGKPNIITCAGVYVDKPNSYHRHGRAFDLDACFWSNYNLITSNFFHDYELYLGIESFLRKHFGIVLNYFYNNSHKDHFHIDNSASVSFSSNQRSKILYVQLVLNYIYKHHVEIDGLWGSQTTSALNEVFELLNISGRITTKRTWLSFLTKTGKLAFAQFDRNKNPRRLLNEIYAVLIDSQLNSPTRIEILNTLNNFKNHNETIAWLQTYEGEHDIEEMISTIL